MSVGGGEARRGRVEWQLSKMPNDATTLFSCLDPGFDNYRMNYFMFVSI